MKPRHALILLLFALTAVRLFLIGQTALAPDEAYYFLWSTHPDLAYYSKGPGVALAIRLGTALFGPTEFGVRFLSPLLALGTSLLLFHLARRIYSESAGFWTVILLNATPIFNVGSLVMTIDPLSIFFWTAAVFSFWLALERAPRFSAHWILAGLLVGLGFLCKYTNAMFLLSAVVVLAIDPRWRGEFRRPGFFLMLLSFAVCTLPSIVWNSRNQWITVGHLRARGNLDSPFQFHPGQFLEFLAVHFGVYSPIVFGGVLAAVVWAWRGASRDRPRLFLLGFGLPLPALYFFLSFKQAGEANWTAPAFVTLGVLAAALWIRKSADSPGLRRLAVGGLALGMCMAVLVPNTDLVRMAGIGWSYDNDPSGRLRGWQSAAEAVDRLRKDFESTMGDEVFLIGDRYQTAASLSFYLPDKRTAGPGHPPVYIAESQTIENQFSFWPRYDGFIAGDAPAGETAFFTEQKGYNPFLHRTALYVTDRAESEPSSVLLNSFESCEMIAMLEVRRRGAIVKSVRVFACYNYLTMPL